MRRALCAFQILLFGLGPLTAMLPVNAESRLPACCRRHGTHHCAMSAAMASMPAQASSTTAPAFTSPSHCSQFPGYLPALTTPVLALTASPVSLPVLLASAHSPAGSRAAARLSQIRSRAGRAPPASFIG